MTKSIKLLVRQVAAPTLTHKSVVLAIGSAASDPATWADVAETMAFLEALADA